MKSMLLKTFDAMKDKKFATIGLRLIGVDILLSFLSGLRLVVKRFFDNYQGILLSDLFSVDKDLSIGEFFQYFKELWLVALCLMLFRKTRERIYIAWSLLFFYLLLDDSLRIHETAGSIITDRVTLPALFGLSQRDMGELVITGLIGGILISIVAFTYFRAEKTHQQSSLIILSLIVLLAGFGVFIDLFGSLVYADHYELRRIAHIIEDGGEMVAMSLLVWVVLVFNGREESK